MAANFASKSNSKASGSHMEAMFAQAQKTQAALQEDYKNAPMTTPSKAGSKVPQARHGKASGLKPSYGSAAPKPKPRSNAISTEVSLRRRSILMKRMCCQKRFRFWLNGFVRVDTVLSSQELVSAQALVFLILGVV